MKNNFALVSRNLGNEVYQLKKIHVFLELKHDFLFRFLKNYTKNSKTFRR